MQRLSKQQGRQGARLWVPPKLIRLIPEGTYFEPELTEDGVLFRRVDPPKAPSWTIQPQGDITDVLMASIAIRNGTEQVEPLYGHGPRYD